MDEQQKIRDMLAKDPHCKVVTEPKTTEITLLAKDAATVVKAAIKP